MRRYVLRGDEDTVIGALNEHGLACILGLPGIGKTTTARYIALRLREKGLIPLILTSGDMEITSKDKVVEFADEEGKTHTILQIPTSAYLTLDNNLAKGLANAIAEVVNTSFKEKTLGQISKLVTKTELGREVAKAIKSIGEKLNIRVPTETIKSSVEEISKFVDLSEVMEYSAEFCSCFLLGVDVIRLAEKFKGKDEGIRLEKEIVVIIDDVAEFKFSETVALQTLIDWLRKNGAGVLLVKRINFEKEFMEISKEAGDSYAGYANEIFAGSRDARGFFEDKRQAVFLTTPDFDTFEEIIEANIEEKLKPEDVERLYQASGGSPTLAILMHDVGVKYGEETMTEHYYSLEKAKTDVEKARATLNVIRNGIRTIYESAKERNLALLTLFVQPAAHEELEAFCNSSEIEKVFGRLNCSQNLDSYRRIVEIQEEPLADGKRKIYELNDTWKHMRLFLDVLCDTDEGVKHEVKIVRIALLDILTGDSERTGWISNRTVFAALDNMEWLNEKTNEKTIKQAVHWGRTALEYFPKAGFSFLPMVLELTKDGEYDELQASTYAKQLVERSSIMNFSFDEITDIIENAKRLIKNPSEDPAVQAHRAETYSSIAKTLEKYGNRTSSFYMKRAEQMVRSITDTNVRNLAKIAVLLDKVDLYLHSNLDEAWHWAEFIYLLIEKVRGESSVLTSKSPVIDYFKPFGGDTVVNLKVQLDRWSNYAKYLIGQIYMSFDWLDDAETAFEESSKYSQKTHKVDALQASLDHIARIRAIRDFQFENFEDLYKKARDYEFALYPEHVSIASAEYWLACQVMRKEITEGERKDVEERTKMNLTVYALLLGVGHMLSGKFAKNVALEVLETEEKQRIGASISMFAKVVRWLIEDERDKAFKFALFISQPSNLPLLSRLFAELADAIQRGDDEEMKKALVKLFYYHI